MTITKRFVEWRPMSTTENTFEPGWPAVIAKAGNQERVAEILGVKQQTISARIVKGKPPSLDDCFRLSEALGMPRHEIRPDVFPAAVGEGAG